VAAGSFAWLCAPVILIGAAFRKDKPKRRLRGRWKSHRFPSSFWQRT
jgi:hypothetical protein